MNWHADQNTLDRYAQGVIDEAGAFSLEAHLLACPSCRAGLSGAVDRRRLDRVWGEVLHAVDQPRAGLLERILARLGAPDHLARLLAAAPSLRLSWFLAMAAALGFALVAARAVEGGALAFIVVAPLVPVAGVAAAYGRAMDPTFELCLASPTGGFRLMLIRATAVLATSAALAAVAALGLPQLSWTAAAWLLPALALTVLTMALSTAASAYAAAGVVSLVWVVGVTVTERLATEPYAAFGLGAQVLFGAITVASVLVVIGRREAFEVRRRMFA